jgi:hypothetical protein
MDYTSSIGMGETPKIPDKRNFKNFLIQQSREKVFIENLILLYHNNYENRYGTNTKRG